MATTSELVVKVNGDASGLKKTLNDAEKGADAFGDSLKAVAGAVSFGAIVAGIESVVDKYAEQELAAAKLTLALQNQGIYTQQLQEQYEATAAALQKKTGVDDDAIISGQALLQSFVGQRAISEELTKAVTDLAAAQGMELSQAFALVGKSIGSSTNALARYGIEVDSHASKEEKMAQIIDAVNGRWKDQAQVMGGTLSGQIKIASAAFSDLQENLGAKFVPVVQLFTKAFSAAVDFVSQNDWILTLVRDLALAAAAFTGVVSAVFALKAAMTILAGAGGIGLLITAVTLVAAHWNDVVTYMTAIWNAFADNILNVGQGLFTALEGIFTFDAEKIKEGWTKATESFVEGYEQFKTDRDAIVEADDAEQEAKEDAKEQSRRDRNNRNFVEQTQYQKDVSDATKKFYDQEYQAQVQNDARMEYEARKFGQVYAMINRVMHSEIYQGSKQAFGELAALQESSNQTLKGIGKAAAIANIIIRTAESAMNIYAGFSTIPIIGPALGIAGAAAAIAFGAEQVGKVNAAAQGGLLTGGIPGVDSIPVLAQQGELITPTKNFEEVVGSVAATRAAEDQGFMGGGEAVEILRDIRDNQRPAIMIQGDVLADDAFIDRLVEKISDRVEFGNARLLASTV